MVTSPKPHHYRKLALEVTISVVLATSALLLLNFALATHAAPTSELRVCPSGCPYTSLQAAVDAASDGDLIKVAAGSYSDLHQRAGVTQVVYISKSLTIRGGYTTTNGMAEPPNPRSNPTVLDASGQGRVVYVAPSVTVTLEGLTLLNGDGSDLGGGTGSYPDAGGGFYADRAILAIHNSIIVANRSPMAGGGYVNRGAFTLTQSTITHNVAISGDAGGLWLYAPTRAQIYSNTFAHNHTGFNGGALVPVYGNANVAIIHNRMVSNTATRDGGAIFMASGAQICDNDLSYNVAGGSAGAIYINGYSPIVVSNRVMANRAEYYGGGIYANRGVNLQRNSVISNSAGRGGGGIFLAGSGTETARLENNIVAANHIAPGRNGAGILVWGTTPHLIHTTIAENTGGDGTGLYAKEQYNGPKSSAFLTNTIVVSQTIGVQAKSGNTITLASTLWYNNSTDTIGNVISTGSTLGDPAFTAPQAHDYHIGATSKARDAGIPAGVLVDIDGEPRLSTGPVDLGADEFWWPVFLPLVLRHQG